jgi:hypothetical protein
MVIFQRNHLDFQKSFVLDKHQHDFYFCTKLWIPKNPCEHVRSCIALEEKGNTPKDSWRNGFMLKGYAQCVICMKQQQKWRHVMNIGKHMILLTRKAHLTEEVLWHYKLTNKIETGSNKIIKKFWRHDQIEVVIFGQKKNGLHYVNVVQFPFDQPSHKSFCRNVGLCWGS